MVGDFFCAFSFPQHFSPLQILRGKKKMSLLPHSDLPFRAGGKCMSHVAAFPKFSLLASLSSILSGVPILPRRHVRTDYTPVSHRSVWEFQTSFALSGTAGDFKKSTNSLWWSLMYSYAPHLKIKVLLTHIITGMTGWHMPFLLCVSHLPHLYTMTGMGDSVFWLPHPPVKFTQLSTLCAVMAASERLKV